MSDELEHDREVEELIDAADAEARADLHGGTERPPFATIVARAHRIDPGAVGAEAVGAVASGGARPRRSTRLPEDPVADPMIDAWVAAARAEAEHDAQQHASRPRPPMRERTANAPRRWAMVGAGVLLAAVAVLTIGLRPQRTTQVDGETKSQAVSAHERDEDPPLETSDRRDDARERRGSIEGVREQVEAVRADVERAERTPEPAAETIEASAAAAAPTTGHERARSRGATPRNGAVRRVDDTDRLAELDREAQQLLAAGRLDAAERTLAELVRIGGSHRLVEAAFGDRFTIAHRQGAHARHRRLWAEYLRRFPDGRFADDARAGLCRVAAAEEARSCWSAYVRDFPSGTYRERADRALARSDAG